MKDDILTVREVAEMLKLADKTVYGLVSNGEITGFKIGGSWRFRRDDIEALTRDTSVRHKGNNK